MGDPIDDLHRGDYEEFTARRNELAKRLKADGDPEGSEQVKALKKPTRSAWALNQLSAEKPKLRDAVLAAGDELRAAQSRLVAGKGGADELRAARDAERGAIAKALDALPGKLSAAALEKARGTLQAVALDEDVRSLFETARLTLDHEPAGLGGLDSLPAAPARGAKRKKAAGKGRDAKAKRRSEQLRAAEAEVRELERREHEAELNLTSARDVAERAQRDLRRATKERDAAKQAVADARERIAGLR